MSQIVIGEEKKGGRIMIERYGDLWDGDIVVITTNGFVKRNGAAVMGRGCAREAARRYPGLEFKLGQLLKQNGNMVNYLGRQVDGKHIITFPVKGVQQRFNGYNAVRHMQTRFRKGDWVPGWALKADLGIIKQSAVQLFMLISKAIPNAVVYMPRPGCGAGELDWETQVKPILANILNDNRFIVCHK